MNEEHAVRTKNPKANEERGTKTLPITRFEDIEGWQLARVLAQEVYKVTTTGSFARDFSLCDQINRAAGSAMDNTAEGFDGGSNKEFIRFLAYAQRSCSEVQSQLYRAFDRSHISQEQFNSLYEQAAHARSKIGGLIRYLKK
jgi:four helix bundle protein